MASCWTEGRERGGEFGREHHDDTKTSNYKIHHTEKGGRGEKKKKARGRTRRVPRGTHIYTHKHKSCFQDSWLSVLQGHPPRGQGKGKQEEEIHTGADTVVAAVVVHPACKTLVLAFVDEQANEAGKQQFCPESLRQEVAASSTRRTQSVVG